MKAIFLSTLLLASTGAFADYAADDLRNRTGFQGERARAEVKAELQQARAAGAISSGEIGTMRAEATTSLRSRSDVKAEAVQAARSHSVGDLY
jgi:hypothetical protein